MWGLRNVGDCSIMHKEFHVSAPNAVYDFCFLVRRVVVADTDIVMIASDEFCTSHSFHPPTTPTFLIHIFTLLLLIYSTTSLIHLLYEIYNLQFFSLLNKRRHLALTLLWAGRYRDAGKALRESGLDWEAVVMLCLIGGVGWLTY